MSDYPEHDKVKVIPVEVRQACGRLLDWLQQNGYHLARLDKDGCLVPCGVSTHRILGDYFKIDLDKLDQEKFAMLEQLRKETARVGESGTGEKIIAES